MPRWPAEATRRGERCEGLAPVRRQCSSVARRPVRQGQEIADAIAEVRHWGRWSPRVEREELVIGVRPASRHVFGAAAGSGHVGRVVFKNHHRTKGGQYVACSAKYGQLPSFDVNLQERKPVDVPLGHERIERRALGRRRLVLSAPPALPGCLPARVPTGAVPDATARGAGIR